MRRARGLIHRDCLLDEERKSAPPGVPGSRVKRYAVLPGAAPERSHPPTPSLTTRRRRTSRRSSCRPSTLHHSKSPESEPTARRSHRTRRRRHVEIGSSGRVHAAQRQGIVRAPSSKESCSVLLPKNSVLVSSQNESCPTCFSYVLLRDLRAVGSSHQPPRHGRSGVTHSST